MMAVVAHIVVLIFSVLIFVVGGGQVVRDALMMEQMTPALGWKMGYVYLALPIAGVFMVIYTVENLVETLRTPPEQLRDLEAEVEVRD
jgi:TRAP-type C4-dicarboxylate transport system permease small subunit